MFDKLRPLGWPFPKKAHQPPDKTPLIATPIPVVEQTSEMRKKAAPEAKAYARERRYPRYPVAGKNLRSRLFYTEDVVLRNLSVSGACINTIRDLSIGGECFLRIRDEQHPLSVRCEVVWRHEDDCGREMFRGYLVGLRFPGLATGDIVRLKDFMRLHGEPDPKPVSDIHAPGALRFHIVTQQHAVLSGSVMLDVGKISRGGMMVRSSILMEPEERYLMKLFLAGEDEPVKVRGRIASVIPRTARGGPGFDIGVEFLGMTPSETARIDRFIRTL